MITTISKYPQAFYRVSAKIIIWQGAKVLAVKESIDAWTLPGGGIDHGESLETAIARELYEEAAIDQPMTDFTIIGTGTYYRLHERDWIMWLVIEATFDEPLKYSTGADCTAAEFIDPRVLRGSPHRPEQLLYKWCVDPSYQIDVIK